MHIRFDFFPFGRIDFGEIRKRETDKMDGEMDRSEKLKIIDGELHSFYRYCEKTGFSPGEMEMIASPLGCRTPKMEKVGGTVKRVFLLASLAISVGLLAVAAGQMRILNPHLTAIGRLILIQLLPVWDWTSVFYEACLISNPRYGGRSLQPEDCLPCESVESIDRISEAAFRRVTDEYLRRDAPVVVADAMSDWPVMKAAGFGFGNVTGAYLKSEKLMETVPCALISNVRSGSNDLMAFLERIPRSRKWFVHWQNCDVDAVKAIRRFYQRPYFLPSSVAPAHFNWVLMSSDYSGKFYKRIDLDSGLIMVAQIRGSNSFRLTGRSPCDSTCPRLAGELREGEILIFTNYVWSFEYLPGKYADNVAILTETVWEENSM